MALPLEVSGYFCMNIQYYFLKLLSPIFFLPQCWKTLLNFLQTQLKIF